MKYYIRQRKREVNRVREYQKKKKKNRRETREHRVILREKERQGEGQREENLDKYVLIKSDSETNKETDLGREMHIHRRASGRDLSIFKLSRKRYKRYLTDRRRVRMLHIKSTYTHKKERE